MESPNEFKNAYRKVYKTYKHLKSSAFLCSSQDSIGILHA